MNTVIKAIDPHNLGSIGYQIISEHMLSARLSRIDNCDNKRVINGNRNL